MGPQEGKIFITLTIVIIFLLLLSIIFFYFLYKNQRNLSNIQKKLISTEFQSSESERKKIALELHNDIIPQLSGLKLRLSSIEQSDPIINQEIIHSLGESINDIRALSKRVSPITIYGNSFLTSIRDYIKSIGIDQKISVKLIENVIREIEQEKQFLIFRILQEVIQNTLKHSRATELKIEISILNDLLLIRTSDNGIGFNIDKSKKGDGMGLKLIQHIISELGGEMHKAGPAYNGTKYNFKIPLKVEKK